jgi:asparagine synthase (glutamine-hydrolysing)
VEGVCGIAALVSLPGAKVAPDLPRRFDAMLAHRGPDGSGLATYLRDGTPTPAETADVALVHRRLAIIDLDRRADQPMVSADGRYVLVFNGEIYNYVELRAELVGLGHTFQTTSDSEVLIAAVAQWGTAALERFVGMFAFILLDREARELFLARDPFGIKPLFWAVGRDCVALASEILPLLEVPGVGRSIDLARTSLFLAAGQTDSGPGTMFSGVRSLPAGTWARIALAAPAAPMPVQYWRPRVAPERRPLADAAQELREVFVDSIRLHLRSDVPVGIALSGGIDSSAIVAAARAVGGRALAIHTFSFTAEGSDVDESAFIDLAADAAQAQSLRIRIGPEEIVTDIDDLVVSQGEPFGSLSIYAQHRVMNLAAKNGIKVMLDGQGADELFAGYRPYLARRLSELIARFQWGAAARLVRAIRYLPDVGSGLLAQAVEPAVPAGLRSLARLLAGRPLFAPWIDGGWFAARGVQQTGAPPRWRPDFLHAALTQSLTETVLPALLRYEDRNSMAFSIESRVPFLTTRLADFAYAQPSEHLVNGNATSKAVLRTALRGLVPDAILDRRDKVGFATPDRLWASALRPWFGRVLGSDTARALPWLKADVALAALDRRVARSDAFGFDLWRTVNVIRWIEMLGVSYG